MPDFRFEAADAAGKIQRGVLSADTPRAARAQLRAQGLTALALKVTAARGAGSMELFAAKLSDSDLAWATRQLASLLAAGLPLEGALSATVEQAEKKHIADTFSGVRADVRGGQRFSDALSSRPRDFPPIYRALIKAGEDSGDLARIMERLADYIEARNALRAKVLTAFIYPAIVGVVSICIVVFLLAYVVPQVVSAFSQARQELPWITRAMLAASEYVRTWGGLNALAAALLFGVWRLSQRAESARLAWHARILRLPMIGRFALGVNTARFAATLAILSDAGVPLLRALEAARQTLANDCLRRAVGDATARIEGGSGLGAALRQQKVFPPLLCHLVASGEKTGTLSRMLDRAAQTLSADIERRAMAMTAMLEPLMILIMGGVVLTIVLAVMLPIMEINQMVG
ncbi:type II secretion system inner membrane protein GspF [Achromobacter sp. UMC71]|uniref:type II secretion system inner membrane protein GspF n=1 Tax=Achromobacter sp. UMC71 TaxID=1862320 RepID=UPI0016013509|nr:type II secretion system inner membrane protein GspF [Achromobacter sp. UMC71]MBB1627370.1 type II secretion system protein GspF [Achromobacter sp. UMC71]